MFYLQINTALQEFRTRHGLSPFELSAFLADFAPSHLEADMPPMPDPSRVWFQIAGAKGRADFDVLDGADETTSGFWQGNGSARRGDIAVLWCVAPRSYVHSIWRCVSDGFDDPFFTFGSNSIVWIGKPVPVPHVTFRELQRDPTWSQRPQIRARFQGSGGSEVSPKEYTALIDLLRAKGADVDRLPRLRVPALPEGATVLNERDVETLLLEPLLLELGWQPADWTRQLAVRMGRGERVYPDYAIRASAIRGEERAELLVEAKFSIATRNQLFDAYAQAKSYANRLEARVFALVAQEGLWLFERTVAGFSFEHRREATWIALREPGDLAQLTSVLGKTASLTPR